MSIHNAIHLGPYIRIKPKYTTKNTTITKITCPSCDCISGPNMAFCGSCGCKLDTYQDDKPVAWLDFPHTLAMHEHDGYVYLFDSDSTPNVLELRGALDLTNVDTAEAIANFKMKFRWIIENDIEPNVESYEFLWGLTEGWF